jgi:hypothetical protein
MKVTRKNAVKELRNANKESKSFFGVCKLIKGFWINGYDDAFRYFGLEFADFNSKNCANILNKLQKNEDNEVYIWRKMYLKQNGEYILDLDGKRIYIYVQKVVKIWTPSILWTICEQTAEGVQHPKFNTGMQQNKALGYANIAAEALNEEIEYIEIANK